MATFLLFYQLLLEKERMHHFKRFFLLGALMASLLIPTLVFTEYVEVAPQPAMANDFTNPSEAMPSAVEPVTDMDVINWSLLLWNIYALGFLVFAFRFVKNLSQIVFRIRKNPKLKVRLITQVLLKDKMPPHTFFRYIFLNRDAHKTKKIPHEVLLHEETHARQLHSLDVLFIELLQVLLWFNPLLILFKKNIKLNHEFLADSAVLNENIPTRNYQNTLLSFLSAASEKRYQSISMANTIIYSSTRAERNRSIKKRFTVMKKQTSPRTRLLKMVLLLPLLALLLSAFCGTKTVYSTPNTSPILGTWLEKPMEVYAFSISSDGETQKLYTGDTEIPVVQNGGRYYAQYSGQLSELVFDKKENVLRFQGKEYVRFENSNRRKYEGYWKAADAAIQLHIENYNSAFVCDLTLDGKTNSFYPAGAGAKGFGFSYGQEFWSFELKDGKLHDSRGNIYTKQEVPLSSAPGDHPFRKGLTEKELLEYEELAQRYEEAKTGAHRILFRDMERMQTLRNRMSKKQRQNTTTVYTPMTKLAQTSATREQMKEYNALAKKYNAMSRDQFYVQVKEVERLKYIYSLMTEKQKADAEPFPQFPVPPTPPTFRSPPEVRVMPPTPPTGVTDSLDSKMVPPPPPAPVSPLDHVVAMAKKGATFYYQGKKISSDKAIELLKTSKNLHIETTETNSKNPKVKISKKPIQIKTSAAGPKTIETGNITRNGKPLFFTKKDGVTHYFNADGVQVSEDGESLASTKDKRPIYYLNGREISPDKAQELLQNNTSIQVTHEDRAETEYAILLTDLNTHNPNSDPQDNNPNAIIDLTEMIAKDASFYFNDEPITTEKAIWLTQNDEIERVQTIGSKKGKPKVYFWKEL